MIKEKNITATVIATIISLITIVTVFSGFISNQAKLEVQLTNIQKELVIINEKLDKRDEEIKNLSTRLTILENKIGRASCRERV